MVNQRFPLFLFIFCLPFFLTAEVAIAQQQYIPRNYYKAKFEPRKKVLSGAGQSKPAFKEYVSAMDSSTRPAIYMLYVSLKNTNLKEWCKKQKAILDEYPWMLMPQIGLSMTSDGKPEEHYEDKVAQGVYDENIKQFCLAIKEWGIPCFIRVGYEFNGRWNGYNPATYKESFIKIAEAFKTYKVPNAALLWCFAADGNADFTSYYPGDQYVDWWSIDLFSETNLREPKTIAFLDSSLVHKKPVMIGESTPRKVSVQGGEVSWNRWFKPYFNLIHTYPNIKGFCYINWDWSKTSWPDWGDGRIEGNPVIKKKFIEELKSDLYLNGFKESKQKKYFKIR